MTAVLVGGCALWGLAVGSFLTVVIHRVPRRQSIVRPRSACPACGRAIARRDRVPLLSWLLLRGRCRWCGETISVRYPFVELLTATLFAGAALRLGYDWALPAILVLIAGLLALACTDLERLLLPVGIVYPVLGLLGASLVVAAAGSGQWTRLGTAAISGAVAFAFFFGINVINPKWMAFGDVRLSLVIGLGLGWLGVRYALLGFFLAFLTGSVVGLGLVAAKRLSLTTPLPFGVFLAAGALIAILAGQPMVSWYHLR